MPHVSAAQAVELWERAADRTLAERAALLAQFAFPELPRALVERTSVGRRDRAILALREETLGSRMECFVACRRCAARLEFRFDARELLDSEPVRETEADGYELETGGWHVRYRLPTGADVAEVAARTNGDAARGALLERCTLAVVSPDGTAAAFERLPDAARDALEAALEARDPLAAASFSTVCAACGAASDFRFDVVAYFCTELLATAKRLLSDVDILARTYHWREADVLAMSAVRRRCYVESALA
jgi:hypothetical protein